MWFVANCICFALKRSFVVFSVLAVSKPEMKMNATANNVVDGESVTLSCTMRYRTPRQTNVNVNIDHPGAEEIDTDMQKDNTDFRSIVTVKAKSLKTSEEPTMFGPIHCKVDFRQPENTADFASNPVRFSSDEMSAFPILCK